VYYQTAKNLKGMARELREVLRDDAPELAVGACEWSAWIHIMTLKPIGDARERVPEGWRKQDAIAFAGLQRHIRLFDASFKTEFGFDKIGVYEWRAICNMTGEPKTFVFYCGKTQAKGGFATRIKGEWVGAHAAFGVLFNHIVEELKVAPVGKYAKFEVRLLPSRLDMTPKQLEDALLAKVDYACCDKRNAKFRLDVCMAYLLPPIGDEEMSADEEGDDDYEGSDDDTAHHALWKRNMTIDDLTHMLAEFITKNTGATVNTKTIGTFVLTKMVRHKVRELSIYFWCMMRPRGHRLLSFRPDCELSSIQVALAPVMLGGCWEGG
jgi:hypothetical protein